MILNAERQSLRRAKVVNLSGLPDRAGQKNALWIQGGFQAGLFDIDPQDYFLKPRGNA